VKKEKDTLACGLRFLKAISQETLDNFIIKVRTSIDPYECRKQMTGIEFDKGQHEQAS
jgi:hypothetical protein